MEYFKLICKNIQKKFLQLDVLSIIIKTQLLDFWKNISKLKTLSSQQIMYVKLKNVQKKHYMASTMLTLNNLKKSLMNNY